MYSPRIGADLILKLYRMAKALKKPMTHVVDDLLREALAGICVEAIEVPAVPMLRTETVYRIALREEGRDVA